MFRIGALILMQNEERNQQRISRRRLRDASNPLEVPDTSNHGKSYKKTTGKQFSLLAHELSKFSELDVRDKYEISSFWNDLKDRLNSLGPTRNITEWKKVWNDCKRSSKRQKFTRMTLKKDKKKPHETEDEQIKTIEEDNSDMNYNSGDAISQQGLISQDSIELELTPNESNSMYSGYIRDTTKQHYYELYNESDNDELSRNLTRHTPTQNHQVENHFEMCSVESNANTSHPTLNYLPYSRPPPLHKPTMARIAEPHHNNLPELPYSDLVQHTMYTLQNQMDHQTKMLEHMSQISNSMALLMERQVMAVEKQTEAVRRQAIAMEHHTLVMNSFLDMVKERMPKNIRNKNKRTMASREK